MFVVNLQRADDFAGWREAARGHLAAGTAPENIVWQPCQSDNASRGGSQDLFAQDVPDDNASLQVRHPVLPVPRNFMELAERVVCHSDLSRFALLYRVLWRRALGGESQLLDQSADPDIYRLHQWGKNVARERHKMHAFVRFRQTPGVVPEHYHAWFEPEHHSLRLSISFFVRRFSNMHWSIVTPAESAHWDGNQLIYGPGGQRGEGPGSDSMETLWLTYFASIFNPARLMVDAMQSEMPIKYWKNLPESVLIQGMTQDAGARTASMITVSHEKRVTPPCPSQDRA